MYSSMVAAPPSHVYIPKQAFNQWLCRVLVAGLYPGGPYARKLLCVELLNALLDTWPFEESGAGSTSDGR